jgi:hypothetical protein
MRVLLVLAALACVVLGPLAGEQLGSSRFVAAAFGIVPALALLTPLTMPRASITVRLLVVVIITIVAFGIHWLL